MTCDKQKKGPGGEPYQARVLIADDEVGLRDLLERFFISRGLAVDLACDGAEALDMFKHGTYDLLLTDLRMPGLDGLQLLAAVKDMRPEVPVVIISGYGDAETVVSALKGGAENFLAKPIKIDLLHKVVEQSLHFSSQPRKPRRGFAAIEQATTISVPSQPAFINELVYFISASAVIVGYADHDLDTNIKLALVESITNAMEHGNKWDEAKQVTIELRLSPDDLTATISDQGEGFDHTERFDPTQPDTMMDERGRGIFLINAIMDQVRYHGKGNSVTISKQRAT